MLSAPGGDSANRVQRPQRSSVSGRLRIPDKRRHRFRSKPTTISDSIPPLIPTEVCHHDSPFGAGTEDGRWGSFHVTVRLMRESGCSSAQTEDPDSTLSGCRDFSRAAVRRWTQSGSWAVPDPVAFIADLTAFYASAARSRS